MQAKRLVSRVRNRVGALLLSGSTERAAMGYRQSLQRAPAHAGRLAVL